MTATLESAPSPSAAEDETDRTSSAGRSRSSAAARWAFGLSAGLILIVMLTFLGPGPTSSVPYAPDNPEPDGARAAAEVLKQQGVGVRHVRTTDNAIANANAKANEGTTLVVVLNQHLRIDQIEALADLPADIVLLGANRSVGAFTDRIAYVAGGATVPRPADCSDPHAIAAGYLELGGPLVEGTSPEVETCFTDAAAGGSLYATWTQGGRTWRVLSNPAIVTNARLAEHGHAALVFRVMGQHDSVIWYVPSPNDPFGLDDGEPQYMPLLTPPLIALYVVLGLALIWWRGRHLGPVLSEPMPVVVKATETTRGRGRLYRRNEAYAHAAVSLRAGTVARLSGRLGLSRWSGRDDVVDAIARASGRSPDQIDSVLYSPPPNDAASLVALTEALDIMESEVHRP